MCERVVRAVHPFVVFLRAGVELGPYLAVVLIENRKARSDVGLGEVARVGDEHELGVVQTTRTPSIGGDLNGLLELWAGRRFAVAAESDVADVPPVSRYAVEGRFVVQLAARREVQEPVEFGFQDGHLDFFGRPGRRPVHLTIDAIEVAGLVGVQVDADGQAAAPPGDDGIAIDEVPPAAVMPLIGYFEGGLALLFRHHSALSPTPGSRPHYMRLWGLRGSSLSRLARKLLGISQPVRPGLDNDAWTG